MHKDINQNGKEWPNSDEEAHPAFFGKSALDGDVNYTKKKNL